jgi:hypothetical protein
VLKVSTFGLNASFKTLAPMANGSIDNQLIKIVPGI